MSDVIRSDAGGSFPALLAVEFRRLGARRLVRILVLLAVAAIAVACVIVAVRSTPPAAGELAIARTTFELTAVRGVLLGLAAIFAILGLLIGATCIGAEWHAGTMATLLTWEPRRIRVGLAKAASCAGTSFLAVLGLEILLGGLLAGVAATRGTTVGADGAFLADTLGIAVRAAAVASALALVGYALASIGRNTAAALGAGFVYFAFVEGLIRGLRPGWQPWLIGENSALFIEGGHAVDLGHSSTAAGALIGVYALVALAIGVEFLRRRDVT